MLTGLLSSLASLGSQPPLHIRESIVQPDINAASVGWGDVIEPPRNTAEFLTLYETLVVVHVCAMINAQGTALGRLRFVHEETGDDISELHPIWELFSRVNDGDTWTSLLEELVLDLELTGNGYFELTRRTPTSPVTEFHRLRPSRMEIIPDKTGKTAIAGYKHTVDNRPKLLAPEQVWHLKYAHPSNDWYGLSPLAAGTRALISDENLEKRYNALLKNGANLGGVLTWVEGTQDDQIRGFRKAWDDTLAGVANTGKIFHAVGGQKFERIAQTAMELEALKVRQWNRDQVLDLMRVPAMLYGTAGQGDARGTRENAQTQRQFWFEGKLAWEGRFLSDGITETLLPQLRAGGMPGLEGVVCVLDYTQHPIALEMQETTYAGDREDVKIGIITIDEAREKRGREAFGGAAAEPIIPLGFMPLKALGARPEPERQIRQLVGELAKCLPASSTPLLESRAFPIDDLGEDPLDIDDPLYQQMRQIFEDILKLNGDAALVELGIEVDFDATSTEVQEYLRTKIIEFADETWNTTSEQIRSTLLEGLDEGETIQDLAARVHEAFEGRRSIADSQRVARTETAGSANKGAMEAYLQADLEEHEWITARDSEVRDGHLANEEQGPVRIGEPFQNGQEFPGDTSVGDVGKFVNCRCGLVAVIPGVERSADRIDGLWRSADARIEGQEPKVRTQWIRILNEQERQMLAAMEAEP